MPKYSPEVEEQFRQMAEEAECVLDLIREGELGLDELADRLEDLSKRWWRLEEREEGIKELDDLQLYRVR